MDTQQTNMPLPEFEHIKTVEKEDDVEFLSVADTLQKVNQLNFADINYGAIRPGAGSVIDGNLIVDGTVSASKIIVSGIKTSELNNDAGWTDTGDLGDLAYEDAVEKSKLGTTIIDGGYLVTGMITASRIDTGTLSADRLSVSELNALNIKAGSVDAEDITGNTITGKTVRTSSGTTRVQMDASSNSIGIISNGRTRVYLGEGVLAFYDSNENFSGNIFGSASNSVAITSNTGSAAPRLTLGSSYLDLVNADLRLECDLLARWGGDYDIGKSATRFRDLWLSRDIAFDRYVRNKLEPSSNASYDLGTSTRRWDRAYFDSRLYMYGTTSSRSFVLPNVAGGSNIGSPSLYFNQMFADNVSYKSLNSFDHINDIEAMKKIKLKTVEVEEPDEVGKKEKKMITKQVWDFDSLPKDTKDGEFYNAGAVSGFIIGSIKELIKKVETLESQLQEFKNKV